VFDGNSQALDHILVSPALAPLVHEGDYDAVHVNSEFADQASDHDPQVVRLSLNAKPTVSANGPYTVAEGSSVAVAATGSDPEGGTLDYAWDLDNDGTYETTGQSATFSAAAIDGPATRTIGVRVTDDVGQEGFATATVTITNVAPTATFNAPSSTFAGYPFTLSLTGPSDPSSADTSAGFQYAFDCGNGSGLGAYSSASSASCPTTAVGTRTVHGRIRDKDGDVTEYTATVKVVVTAQSLCNLTFDYIRSSPKYQALPPAARAAVDKLAAAACDQLASLPPNPSPAAKAVAVAAYRVAVTALAQAGWLTSAQATTLKNLAGSL
jgi:PKD domain-containing protein